MGSELELVGALAAETKVVSMSERELLVGAETPVSNDGRTVGEGTFIPGVRPGRIRSHRYSFVSTVSVLVVAALWQLLAVAGVLDVGDTSSPSQIVRAAIALSSSGQLGTDVASSATLYGVSLSVAICIAIPAGIVLGWWRILGAIFDPFVSMLYATPLVALLPLILEWFGITYRSQVVIVVLVALFPMLVSTMAGARHVDPELVRMARSFHIKPWHVMRSVVLPSTLPYMMAGLRLSSGLGLIGVVVAEYFEGDNGIGGLILVAGTNLNTSEVFVGIGILAGFSVVLNVMVQSLERRISRWR
jgi:ABC-type nitrate/sulfonate/bicarbonate transport system permease component